MGMDLTIAGSKTLAGDGGGTSDVDPFVQWTRDPPYSPLGYQQITSLSGAQSLTVPTGAIYAIIVPEVASVRWRDDGTDPTSSVGMPLATGASMVFHGNLSVLKFIQQSAGAKLNIAYYK